MDGQATVFESSCTIETEERTRRKTNQSFQPTQAQVLFNNLTESLSRFFRDGADRSTFHGVHTHRAHYWRVRNGTWPGAFHTCIMWKI
jgi:hypothetical protein